VATVHPDIIIVVFDSNSPPHRTSFLPIPRDYHAKVIRVIDANRPRVIALDFYFVHPTDPDRDRDLLDAIRTAKSPVVLGAVNAGGTDFNAEQIAYQTSFLAAAGREGGTIELDEEPPENVVRFAFAPPTSAQYPETFATVVARVAAGPTRSAARSRASRRIAWLQGPDIHAPPFLVIPAQALLADDTRAAELRKRLENKIVLIGADLPHLDRHVTPLSVRTGQGMLGVTMHAQMVAQILDSRWYWDLSRIYLLFLLTVVGVAGFALSWWMWRTRADFLGQGGATVALVALNALLFWQFRIDFPVTLALYVWGIGVLGGYNLRNVLVSVWPKMAG
jgi:adenylate cyclase